MFELLFNHESRWTDLLKVKHLSGASECHGAKGLELLVETEEVGFEFDLTTAQDSRRLQLEKTEWWDCERRGTWPLSKCKECSDVHGGEQACDFVRQASMSLLT